MSSLLIDLKALVLSLLLRRSFNAVRTDLVIRKWRKRGVIIGEGCYINYDVVLDQGVVIGERTTITGGTIVLTHDAVPATFLDELSRGRSVHNRISHRLPVIIGKRCFVGAKCVVLPGVEIGDDCIVAAGSIVTKNVPGGMIVAGAPARQIGLTSDYVQRQRQVYQERPNEWR